MEERAYKTGEVEPFYLPNPAKVEPLKLPDYSATAAQPDRPSPFILSDFRGIGAYQRPT